MKNHNQETIEDKEVLNNTLWHIVSSDPTDPNFNPGDPVFDVIVRHSYITMHQHQHTLYDLPKKQDVSSLPFHKTSTRRRNRQIRNIGLGHKWKTFLTLTFEDKYIKDPLLETFDIEAVQKCFRQHTWVMRRRFGKYKYLAVLESGKRTHRWHFHMLTDLTPEQLKVRPKVIDGKTHADKFETPYWIYGFSDVVKMTSYYAVFYLLKYVSKTNDCWRTPVGKREVFSSTGLSKKEKIITNVPYRYVPDNYRLQVSSDDYLLFAQDFDTMLEERNEKYYGTTHHKKGTEQKDR